MRERDVERYLARRVRELGGEIRKVSWIGRRHAPDRVAKFPGRDAIWIEVKRPGETPGAGQRREHTRMRRVGWRVEVVDSFERVDEVLRG